MKLRNRIYIDPQVQGALSIRLLMHWASYLAVATVLIVGLRWLFDPFTPITQHFIEAIEQYMLVFMVLFSLTPIFIYDTIKLSNRFTGPMFRFRRTIKELADGGDPEEVHLRKDDFWKDFAKDLNRVMKRCKAIDSSGSINGSSHTESQQTALAEQAELVGAE